jgi:hypothetical protein
VGSNKTEGEKGGKTMIFTNMHGEPVNVDDTDTMVVERSPNYTVYQANVRGNPGETLTKVVYNNPRRNVGGDETSLPDYMMGMSNDEMQELEDNMEPTDEYYGVGEENTDELNNPRGTGSGMVSWRNLRLQAAIDSQKRLDTLGGAAQAARKLTNIGAVLGRLNQNTSIRSYPEMLLLATAEQWYDYVRKMNATDIAAELSAEVSPQEQLAIYGFIKEWEMDPSHRAFRRRVNPGADINSEFAKAQIVYDIMTSKGPDPMKSNDFTKHRYDKMFKLAIDILRSMRLNTYNYYTLNAMHNDEGDRVFMDFRSRYIPLNAEEVEMLMEMQSNVAAGKSYAFQTTATQDQALEADALMRKAVSAYQVGDTRTCRSILTVLKGQPYNYMPTSIKMAVSRAAGGNDISVKATQGEIFRVSIQTSGKGAVQGYPNEALEGNMGFLSVNKGNASKLKEGKLPKAGDNKDMVLVAHKSYFDPTPVGILSAASGKWAYSDYNQFMDKGAKTFEDQKQRSKRGRIQQAVKSNPVGRGNYLFLEIHPKSQLKMKRGHGEEKHGKSKDTTKWTKGLNKHFPGQKLVQVGTLKSTGEDAPYRIRLPVKYFKPVTHPTKGYKTIGLKKGDPELQKTWQKIVDTYGMPKMASTKGTHYRFIVDKTERGTYYDAVRRKTGKAKASR